ncbi:hypothetical protein NP233_g1269 [Leucocoprinus birnbaumii]|uniref:Protein kinase domain-containing protein n=1 Tax=Leucocoprinus birnbaumii TaxID=56174 RepID=A0AAD5W0T9_9AGAR|nr:hypothetical protein NP233_g1269 [Leucocoprinus birnbaumii]
MPPGVGVVDAFKNLIRHGKHHHAARSDAPKSHDDQSAQPTQANSRASRKQEQAHIVTQPTKADPSAPHDNRRHQQPMKSPPALEIVQSMVDEERENKSKMPTYKGLENFKLLEKMGDGAFSNVYKAIEISSGKKVAVKVVRKYELNASQAGDKHLNPQFKKKPRVTERANILKEVQIMRGINNPAIVKLYNFFESPEHYFLIMELMEGGELFHQIVKLTYFSENLARHVILQVASGIRYLHEERGVVHRDIKPENLLFDCIDIIPSKNPVVRPYDEEKEDEGEFILGVGGGGIGKVKIADFGLSKVVWNEETMTPCGTVGYTAPEIVKDERYSKSVDMWAMGCVLYTLLCGFPPFYDESINVLTEKVARGYYTFLSPWWDDISHSAKDLIQHLLCVDPSQRYTIDEFLAHPWCNAAPAPPPPPTPRIHGDFAGKPLDSPLLSAARGRVQEGKSPGLATLKEAFDITYAVHRMEEEGARRRKYNGRAAGARGFLSNLNEDEEEEPYSSEDGEESGKQGTDTAQRMSATANPQDTSSTSGSASGSGRRARGRGPKEFELDLQGATLLGRRHKKGIVGAKSPLSAQPIQADTAPHPDLSPGGEFGMAIGSPMHS